MEVHHQHGNADISQDLDGLEDCTLVRVELLGDRADVWLAADLDDGVGGAKGLQGANSSKDIVPVRALVDLHHQPED